MGQSGGAGKVSTLMAMPSAKGLFHRAIIQSGANLAGITKADATKTAQALMAKLGVKTAAELQKVPMDTLIQATLNTQGLALRPGRRWIRRCPAVRSIRQRRTSRRIFRF